MVATMSRKARWILGILGVAVALDAAAWGLAARRRADATERLEPVLVQMDSLAGLVAAEDLWLERNGRLTQGYGQSVEFGEHLTRRGELVRLHNAYVDSYNEALREAHRRTYLGPIPTPTLRAPLER